MALSGDTLCLGMPLGIPAKSAIACGVVDVFTRAGATWSYSKTLLPSDPVKGARFGAALAFDSGRLVVGAPYTPVSKLGYAGACYIFTGAGSAWKQSTKLVQEVPGYGFQFGGAVSISGNCLLIGSPGQGQLVGSPSRPYSTIKGGVTAYHLEPGGKWLSEGLLPPPAADPDPSVISSPQSFGFKMAVSSGLAVVSNSTLYPTTERSYVYQRRGGRWVQLTPLVDNGFDITTWDPSLYDPFNPPLFNLMSSPGGVPAISGSTIMIGSPSELTNSGVHSGAVHFFSYAGPALAVFDGPTTAGAELRADEQGLPVNVMMNDLVLDRTRKQCFTLQNLGTTPIINLSITSDNPDVVVATPSIASLATTASSTLVLNMMPSVEGFLEAHVLVKSGSTILLDFDLQAAVYSVATPPVIMMDPSSAALRVGATFELTADVVGTEPLFYQWYRDGKPCNGCTSKSLLLSQVTLASKGVYELLVSNEGGGAFSGPAIIDVYGAQPAIGLRKLEGDSLQLTTPVSLAKGSQSISVAWFLNNIPLTDSPKINGVNGNISGSSTPTLTINGLTAATGGKYTAIVTTPTESVAASSWVVVVYLRPVIQGAYDTPMTMSVISPITMHVSALPAASSFYFTGLPAGVVADTRTGTISGRPKIAGNYTITVAGINAAGKGTAKTIRWIVQPIDPKAVGKFQGIVGRDPGNNGLGGTVTFTTTANGSCTGVATAGPRSIRFTAPLQFKPDGSPVRADVVTVTGTVVDRFILDIDTKTGRLSGQYVSSLSTSTSSTISGWNNPWSKTTPAAGWTDYLTVALRPPADLDSNQNLIPAGTSVGSATVQADGVLTWVGRLADGSVITASTSISGTQSTIGQPDRVEAPFFFPLSSRKGSALGLLQISQPAASSENYHSVTGTLDWFKLPVPGRSYSKGITLHTLTAAGGPYAPPEQDAIVLGLPVALGNVQLDFAGAGSETAFQYPLLSLPFTITIKNFSDFGVPNYLSSVLSINLKTGVFSGTAQISDPNPANPNVNVRRTVSSYGVLLKTTGQGYFTLPALPDPTALPPTTTATSPIQSGRVLLREAN